MTDDLPHYNGFHASMICIGVLQVLVTIYSLIELIYAGNRLILGRHVLCIVCLQLLYIKGVTNHNLFNSGYFIASFVFGVVVAAWLGIIWVLTLLFWVVILGSDNEVIMSPVSDFPLR